MKDYRNNEISMSPELRAMYDVPNRAQGVSDESGDAAAHAQPAPWLEREVNGGVQKVYRFPNGYGASVVRGPFTYGGKDGLWELAVVKFNGDKWPIVYDTSITDDVEGFLTDDAVSALLIRIAALEAA